MLRSAPDLAGRYADQGRHMVSDTGRHAFPSPAMVPAMMQAFAARLRVEPAGRATAFTAHAG